MEAFASLLDWFGPLIPGRDQLSFLRKIEQECSAPWFHGSIDMKEAETRLASRDPGMCWDFIKLAREKKSEFFF